jgi:hypothetical protein
MKDFQALGEASITELFQLLNFVKFFVGKQFMLNWIRKQC